MTMKTKEEHNAINYHGHKNTAKRITNTKRRTNSKKIIRESLKEWQ